MPADWTETKEVFGHNQLIYYIKQYIIEVNINIHALKKENKTSES